MSSSEDEDSKIFIEKPVEKSTSTKSLDDLLQLRWYCVRVLLMAGLSALTSLSSNMFMVFAGANPGVIGCDTHQVDNCHDLRELQNSTGCIPKLDYQFLSTQVEFGYICEDAKKVKNTITVQTFGVLIGAAIFGQISDNFGRRKALLIVTVGSAISSLVAAFTPDLISFMIVRMICGIFAGGLSVIQMVFMVENIPKAHRMWIQNTITWSPMLTIYPLIAYFTHDWRTLSIVISCTSLMTFLAVLTLYESPRWLVQKGKIEEARRVLIAIREANGTYNEAFEKELDSALQFESEMMDKQTKKKGKKYTFIHLFCTWKMIGHTLTFVTGIVCTTSIVYSLMYNMEKLSGSLYWNCAITGASRWAVNIIVSILDFSFPQFGRKIANQISMTFTILALFAIIASILEGYNGPVLTIGTFIASSMCAQLFILKYLMVNELYPTAVRNLAVSAVSTMSRIGSMFSPQLFYLAEYAEWLPYAVILLFQAYDLLVFTIFIPETKGSRLKNHLPPKNERIFGNRRRN